jgi:beta-mannosidase
MSANVIKEDPYFRFNELEQSWVSKEKCWKYEANIYLDNRNINEKVFLQIEGLDTIGSIFINDKSVGTSSNAFQTYVFDVTDALLDSNRNKVLIEISSPIDYALTTAANYPYSVPATVNYNVWAEPSSRNFIRKAGNDFGWDWGPAYVPSGITGEITLFQSPSGKFENFVLLQSIASDYSSVDLSGRLRFAGVSANNDVTVTMTIDDKAVLKKDYMLSSSSNVIDIDTVSIKNPTLWYPSSMGNPHLYKVDISVCSGSDVKSCQSISRKIGIRNVELIQEPMSASADIKSDEPSLNVLKVEDSMVNNTSGTFRNGHPSLDLYTVEPASYYFKVNGEPIFAKGANFIPIDSFSSRVTDNDRYTILLSILIT